MLDFGLLPPEVNSACMYTGPGSGPMLAAAAAWESLAAELSAAAAGYQTATAELAEIWRGPSATAMLATTGSYVEWLTETAAGAELTAARALSTAAAYQAAFTATVPPPVVAANRMLWMSLVATNFLGQNTTAIAAAEVAYAEMWAQDAAAMYGYADAAAAATDLTPFRAPDQGAAPAQAQAAETQAAGSQAAAQAKTALTHTLAASPQPLTAAVTATEPAPVDAFATLLAMVGQFNTLTGPLTPAWQLPYATYQWLNMIYAAKADLEAHSPAAVQARPVSAAPTTPRGAVLASAQRAIRVGGLSVPQGWTTAATPTPGAVKPPPLAATAFRALPSWAAQPEPSGPVEGGPAGPAGCLGPMRGMSAPPQRKKVLRMRNNPFAVPRFSVGG